MTRNKWIIVVVAAVVILGGLIAFSGRGSVDVANIATDKIISAGTVAGKTKVDIGDHVYGATDGRVLLVEYGDFQCPYCGDLHPYLKPLVDYYKGQMGFVFRNFPLTNAHPNALAAATAAESAGLQGNDKYWAMHDALYENQPQWTGTSASARTGVFQTLARGAGVNVDTFTSDLTSDKIATKINFDKALGAKDNVQGTPSLYLQGKNLGQTTTNAQNGNTDDLETAIRAAISDAGLTPPAKTYAQSKNQ